MCINKIHSQHSTMSDDRDPSYHKAIYENSFIALYNIQFQKLTKKLLIETHITF